MKEKAIVLLSGGLDSATAAAIAVEADFEVHALSFKYGQKHSVEIRAAAQISKLLKLSEHTIMDLSGCFSGGSALVDEDKEIPMNRPDHEIGSGIPATYVPGRNIIFLSFALSYAETIGASHIFTGFNQVDYSGYPDCRIEFVKSFEAMANIGTKHGSEGGYWTIHTPLITLTKAQIIERGTSLSVPYKDTVSCYQAKIENDTEHFKQSTIFACGVCDSCILRRKGFEEAGIPDPTAYAKSV